MLAYFQTYFCAPAKLIEPHVSQWNCVQLFECVFVDGRITITSIVQGVLAEEHRHREPPENEHETDPISLGMFFRKI